MPTLTFRSAIDAPAGRLFAWHANPGAFERLTPPWAPVRLEKLEGIKNGDQAVIRLGPGPASIRWVAEHFGYEEGRQFCDRQVKGPFAQWTHTHRMEPHGENESFLVDDIEYTMPFGGLGDALAPRFAEPELRRQFAYRHRVTRRDLDLHQHYNPDARSLTIAISGASGLIGSSLSAFLTAGGHTVRRIVRSGPTGPDTILWNYKTGAIEARKFNDVDAVIHLAGENVFALRWTEAKKRRIYASRDEGTRLLSEALATVDNPPDTFLSASAVGYYGDYGTQVVTEDMPPSGDGFLIDVCRAWEAATKPAAEAGIRTAQLRIGVVLTPAGGALQLMLPAFQLGLGGAVGSKDSYVPWIALDDVIGGFYHTLMTDGLSGPVNLTGPEPTRMAEYAGTLAGVLSRPALLSVPSSAVRLAFGDMADEFMLKSARVVPQRLQDTGYAFGYPTLEGTLRHVLGKTLIPHRPLATA